MAAFIPFCILSFTLDPSARNTIPSSRRKNIWNDNTISENVFTDNAKKKEMSKGAPNAIREKIAAKLTIIFEARAAVRYRSGDNREKIKAYNTAYYTKNSEFDS